MAQGIHPNRSEGIRAIIRASLEAIQGVVDREEEVAP